MVKKYSELTDAEKEERREHNRAYRRLKVYLYHHKANSSGRVVLQMIVMAQKQAFTMSIETQAEDLGLSTGVIYKGRRLAVRAGLLRFEKKLRGYVHTVVPNQSVGKRFNESTYINLGLRSQTLRIDLAARTEDGKAHGSAGEFAKMLHASPRATALAMEVADKKVDIFEPEFFPDGRHAYRPRLELVPDTTKAKPIQSARYILEHEYDIKGPNIGVGFIKKVLKPARLFKLTDDDHQLVRALAKLRNVIKQERQAAGNKSQFSAGEVMERYIEHLKEQIPQWDRPASLKVLSMESKTWKQFRHQWEHLEGEDPITGKMKVYE